MTDWREECQSLSDEVERLRAENEKLREYELDCYECAKWLAENEKPSECIQRNRHDAQQALNLLADTTTERDTLRAALEFYADPETYHAVGFWLDPPCGEFQDDFGDFDEHRHPGYERPMPGKRARQALEGSSDETRDEADPGTGEHGELLTIPRFLRRICDKCGEVDQNNCQYPEACWFDGASTADGGLETDG